MKKVLFLIMVIAFTGCGSTYYTLKNNFHDRIEVNRGFIKAGACIALEVISFSELVGFMTGGNPSDFPVKIKTDKYSFTSLLPGGHELYYDEMVIQEASNLVLSATGQITETDEACEVPEYDAAVPADTDQKTDDTADKAKAEAVI